MKEFIEKLIERLKENRRPIVTNDEDLEWNRAMYLCTGIVNQLAEEYADVKNSLTPDGWIPVSSGILPKNGEDVEVTIEEIANDVGGKRYYNSRSWLQDGQWVIKKNPYKPTVIAWKYPTAPYQPKGE